MRPRIVRNLAASADLSPVREWPAACVHVRVRMGRRMSGRAQPSATSIAVVASAAETVSRP